MMLALAKRLPGADSSVRKGRYDPQRVRPENGVAYNWTGLSGLSGLLGKIVGVIGFGEVGALTASMVRAFGARVIYVNRTPLAPDVERAYGVDYAPLDRLLEASHFVSLHATNISENRAMIGPGVFTRMKASAFFINTSRGRLVDEDALIKALKVDAIAGAGLDVHFREPRVPDRFCLLPNVILSPHVAGGTRESVLFELEGIFNNCRAWLAREPVQYRVQ